MGLRLLSLVVMDYMPNLVETVDADDNSYREHEVVVPDNLGDEPFDSCHCSPRCSNSAILLAILDLMR